MFKKMKAWAKSLKRQIFTLYYALKIQEHLGMQNYLLLVWLLMRSVQLT